VLDGWAASAALAVLNILMFLRIGHHLDALRRSS
jgi:hypothetical protein